MVNWQYHLSRSLLQLVLPVGHQTLYFPHEKNPNTFHLDHCSFPLRHSSVLKQGCLEQVPTHPVTSDNNFIQLHSNRLASFPSEKPPPNHIACYLVTPYFPSPLLYNSLGKKQTLSTWVHFPSSPYSGLQQGWFKPAPTHLSPLKHFHPVTFSLLFLQMAQVFNKVDSNLRPYILSPLKHFHPVTFSLLFLQMARSLWFVIWIGLNLALATIY